MYGEGCGDCSFLNTSTEVMSSTKMQPVLQCKEKHLDTDGNGDKKVSTLKDRMSKKVRLVYTWQKKELLQANNNDNIITSLLKERFLP